MASDMYVHSISCRNSLFLFLNNLKIIFSQFRAKTKHLKPTQIQTYFDTTFCSSNFISLSHLTLFPIHANPFMDWAFH